MFSIANQNEKCEEKKNGLYHEYARARARQWEHRQFPCAHAITWLLHFVDHITFEFWVWKFMQNTFWKLVRVLKISHRSSPLEWNKERLERKKLIINFLIYFWRLCDGGRSVLVILRKYAYLICIMGPARRACPSFNRQFTQTERKKRKWKWCCWCCRGRRRHRCFRRPHDQRVQNARINTM